MAHICHQTVNSESVLGTKMPQMQLFVYRCGGCNSLFETICVLHEHMQSHSAGGSYQYNHSFFTAFPKYGNMCTASQTDFSDKGSVLSSYSGSKIENDMSDFTLKQSNISNNYSDTRDVANSFSELVYESDDVKVETELDVATDNNERSNDTADEIEDEIVEIGFEISKTAEERIIKVEKHNKNIAERIDRTDSYIQMYTGYANDANMPNNQSYTNDTEVEKFNPECGPSIERKQKKVTAISVKKTAIGKSKERKRSSKNKLDYLVGEKHFKKCHVCKKFLSSSAALKRHLTVVHSEERTEKAICNYQCKYCDFNFESKKELQKHTKEEHCDTDKKISCPYCEEEFLTSTTKSQHIDSEHPEIAIVLKKFHQSKDIDLQTACELCGKLFSTAAGLALHMSSIHLKKKFKCDICNVELSQKFTLKAHKIEKHHEDMRGFDCNICKKTFAYKFRLKAHIEKIHTSQEEITNKYICETCGYFSKSKAGLRYHLTKHDVQRKQFQCAICPYKTFYKCSMTEHTASHQGNRRFVCDACGDKFFTSKQLKVHMRRHTGEMPYQCQFCNKKFRTDIAYARHRDIHLNKMRFKCEYCDKEFVQKTNCLAHMRQHTGEKPFKCDWCGQSFTHNVSRKNHMNKCSKRPNE